MSELEITKLIKEAETATGQPLYIDFSAFRNEGLTSFLSAEPEPEWDNGQDTWR